MNEADRNLSVRFWLHPKENPRKSKEAGRPIYDEVEMVSIMAPGNTKTEFTGRAHSMHYDANEQRQRTYAERFAEHYSQFKAGLEEQVQGTPLSEAAFLSVGQRAEMRAKQIKTVEQLAAMSDRDIQKMGMGFRKHVDAARAYLDTANGTSVMTKEIEELRRQIAALQASGPAVQAPEPETDQFDQMADEDLKNMLTDAGVTVDNRWGRKRLLEETRSLAREAA